MEHVRITVAALVEQALRGITLPATRAIQRCDQSSSVDLRKIWHPPLRRGGRSHPIAAAFVLAGAKVAAGLRLRGNPLGLLEHKAIHVRDVERAVRAGLEHRRAEP